MCCERMLCRRLDYTPLHSDLWSTTPCFSFVNLQRIYIHFDISEHSHQRALKCDLVKAETEILSIALKSSKARLSPPQDCRKSSQLVCHLMEFVMVLHHNPWLLYNLTRGAFTRGYTRGISFPGLYHDIKMICNTMQHSEPSDPEKWSFRSQYSDPQRCG